MSTKPTSSNAEQSTFYAVGDMLINIQHLRWAAYRPKSDETYIATAVIACPLQGKHVDDLWAALVALDATGGFIYIPGVCIVPRKGLDAVLYVFENVTRFVYTNEKRIDVAGNHVDAVSCAFI